MKAKLLRTVPHGIFLAAYSLIVFLVAKEISTSFIWSYAFAAAGILVHASWIWFFESKFGKVYTAYPIAVVLASFMIVAVLMNTVTLILSAIVGYTLVIILNIILYAGYGIYFFFLYKNMSYIEKEEDETNYRLEFVRNASLKLKLAMDSVKDFQLSKKVEYVYDEVRNSQAVGTDATQNIEREILDNIDDLVVLCEQGDQAAIIGMCDNVLRKLKNRNLSVLSTRN